MAVKIEYIEIKSNKRGAVKCKGELNRELGEALVEHYPALFEIGTPLNQISKLILGEIK